MVVVEQLRQASYAAGQDGAGWHSTMPTSGVLPEPVTYLAICIRIGSKRVSGGLQRNSACYLPPGNVCFVFPTDPEIIEQTASIKRVHREEIGDACPMERGRHRCKLLKRAAVAAEYLFVCHSR